METSSTYFPKKEKVSHPLYFHSLHPQVTKVWWFNLKFKSVYLSLFIAKVTTISSLSPSTLSYLYLHQWLATWATLESPGELLKLPTLRTHSRPSTSESLGDRSQMSAYFSRFPYDSNMQPDLRIFQNWRYEPTDWKCIPNTKQDKIKTNLQLNKLKWNWIILWIKRKSCKNFWREKDRLSTKKKKLH